MPFRLFSSCVFYANTNHVIIIISYYPGEKLTPRGFGEITELHPGDDSELGMMMMPRRCEMI